MHKRFAAAVPALVAVIALNAAAQSKPAQPSATAPKDMTVPNSTAYPSEVGGRSLEEWIKEIDNPDPSVREQAIQTVLLFGPSATKAIPAITGQVQRLNDIGPQAHAIIALSELIPARTQAATSAAPDKWTGDAVNALISVLNSPEAVIRFRAGTTLGWIGPPARAAVHQGQLTRLVTDRASWEIRKAACFALGTVGRDEQGWPLVGALEALANGLADQSKGVRLEALQAVIRLGPLASSAAPPRLTETLRRRLTQERDKNLLVWVRVAMMRLNAAEINDKNLAPFTKDLKGSDSELRTTTIKALGLMGPAAKSAVPDLIETLQKPIDPATIIDVCTALSRMGQFADRAIGPLTTLQSTGANDVVRSAAGEAIIEIKKAIDAAKQQPPGPQPPVKKP
ncbi:MAG TPA: HEAT repeat domain-containing protein [Gemmataceae bacterium]|nr:HEAT repeat domain-containing protein [Gemmataceae bacterium]